MKSTFLQVMGILFIISGAAALILNIVMMRGYVVLGIGFPGVISVIRGALLVVAGIKAVTTYTDRYRAAACVVWGAMVIIMTMAELIVTLAYLSWVGFAVIFFIILLPFSLILPVLYFVAAFRFVRQNGGRY